MTKADPSIPAAPTVQVIERMFTLMDVLASKEEAISLKEISENGSPALGTRILFGVFGLLAFTTPAKCLSTHWPLEESRDG